MLTIISTSGSITSPITTFLVVIKHVWLTSLQSMSPSMSSLDVSLMAL